MTGCRSMSEKDLALHWQGPYCIEQLPVPEEIVSPPAGVGQEEPFIRVARNVGFRISEPSLEDRRVDGEA